jgi:hypothetical protein
MIHIAITVGESDRDLGVIVMALVHEPSRGFRAIGEWLHIRCAYMNGRIAMQITENTPWSREGSLHAQVEFGQLEVPNVIPAAINAPTLNTDERDP